MLRELFGQRHAQGFQLIFGLEIDPFGLRNALKSAENPPPEPVSGPRAPAPQLRSGPTAPTLASPSIQID